MNRTLPLRITMVTPPHDVPLCLQQGKDALVPPSASSGGNVSFDLTVKIANDRAGGPPNFRGPAVQGPPAGRFVYINSGTLAGQADSCWSRRADVHISRSFDGGETWGKPFVPHRDGTQTEHGFVSMFAAPGGALAAVWLDGREMKGHDAGQDHGRMTLRYVAIRRDGSTAGEEVLDSRVCECCQTSVALTGDGPVVVYRDRSEQEVRDISVIRWRAGKWSSPSPLSRDGWQINGCPVNGPAVAASGRRVAAAWFTGAENKPRVRVAFSADSGENFGQPVTVDDGNPAGRVDVLLLPDGSAMVSWLEKLAGGGEVRVRRVSPDGRRGESLTVAPSGTARSSGFPQMVRSGDTLVFAYTGPRVLTAVMPLPR